MEIGVVLGHFPGALFASETKEAVLKKRSVDKERFERADREAKKVLYAERQARNAKTARLRDLRLGKYRDQSGTHGQLTS